MQPDEHLTASRVSTYAILAALAFHFAYGVLWRLGVLSMFAPALIALSVALAPLPEPLSLARSAHADDTAYLQGLFDTPDADGFVRIPAGKYVSGPLTVPVKTRSIRGEVGAYRYDEQLAIYLGTTIKLSDGSGDFRRLIKVINGANCFVADLQIDMNRSGNGPYIGWEQAHNAGIFVEAGTCLLRNVHISNSGGDGVYVYHDGKLDAAGLSTHDIYRAGFGVTGKNSVVTLKDSTLTLSGIDIEPNSSSDKVDVTVEDCTMDEFDVAVSNNGSKFVGRRIKSPTCNLWYLYCHPQATFLLEDCQFALTQEGHTAGRFKVRLPGMSTFRRCQFTNGISGKAGNLININWTHQSITSNQTWTMEDCLLQGPANEGFNLTPDVPANNNHFNLTRVQINGVDKAITYQNGKKPFQDFEDVTHNGNPVNP